MTARVKMPQLKINQENKMTLSIVSVSTVGHAIQLRDIASVMEATVT